MATDSTNPGSTCVANQAYAPAQSDPARSCGIASASAVTSNGEQQRGHQDTSPSYNGTVTKTEGSAPLKQLSGEGGQRLDRQRTPKAKTTHVGITREIFAGLVSFVRNSEPPRAATTGKGLPAEVFPGSASPTICSPPTIAICTPPAVSIQADTGRPGGLPVNVNIR